MKIMLCGAGDLTSIEGIFGKLIEGMGFKILYYKRFMYYNNYNNWNENSKESVENADIIVFVINEKFGEITWNTEFETALSLGTPFIILCNEDIFSLYSKLLDKNISPSEDNDKRMCDLLSRFRKEEKTVVLFKPETFQEILQGQIILVLERGVKLLKEENRRKSISHLLEKNLIEDASTLLSDATKLKALKDVLFDILQNKEIRKRALRCFSGKGILTQNEIKQLINDPEQGIRRKIISEIYSFVNEDPTEIFDAIMEVCDSYDDIGLINRAINSMWKTNPKISIKYLHKIALIKSRESVCQRIIYLLNDNIDVLYQYCEDEDFKAQLKDLISTIDKIHESKKRFSETILKLSQILNLTKD